MKPGVLVTREVFQGALDLLSRHLEVSAGQSDVTMDAETLAQALADKHGALTTLTERIDARPCWRAIRGSRWPSIDLWLPHLLYK
jgi:hypothetical protein